MTPIELVGVGSALVGTLAVGLVAHELSHVAVLRAFGVPSEIEWRPGPAASDRLMARLTTPWATVTPRSIPPGVSPWGLRLASIAPLALATPGGLVLVGVLPDPMAAGDGLLAAVTIAWLGCALPSPQDFSLFWSADTVVDAGERPALSGR